MQTKVAHVVPMPCSFKGFGLGKPKLTTIDDVEETVCSIIAPSYNVEQLLVGVFGSRGYIYWKRHIPASQPYFFGVCSSLLKTSIYDKWLESKRDPNWQALTPATVAREHNPSPSQGLSEIGSTSVAQSRCAGLGSSWPTWFMGLGYGFPKWKSL